MGSHFGSAHLLRLLAHLPVSEPAARASAQRSSPVNPVANPPVRLPIRQSACSSTRLPAGHPARLTRPSVQPPLFLSSVPSINSARSSRPPLPFFCPSRLFRPPKGMHANLPARTSVCPRAPSRKIIHSPTRLPVHSPTCTSADPLIHQSIVPPNVRRSFLAPSPTRSPIRPLTYNPLVNQPIHPALHDCGGLDQREGCLARGQAKGQRECGA